MVFRHKDTIYFALYPFKRLSYFLYLFNRSFEFVVSFQKARKKLREVTTTNCFVDNRGGVVYFEYYCRRIAYTLIILLILFVFPIASTIPIKADVITSAGLMFHNITTRGTKCNDSTYPIVF